MRRGHRRMHHLTGLPGPMRAGHHGRCHCGGHSPSHHAPILCEGDYEPCWAGPWGAPPTAGEERDFLRDQAEALRRHLGRIERRITELESSGA